MWYYIAMSEVQFQNEWRPPRYQPETSRIISWVIKYSGGLIKNEREANRVLLVLIVVIILSTLFMVLSGGSQQGPVIPGGPLGPL